MPPIADLQEALAGGSRTSKGQAQVPIVQGWCLKTEAMLDGFMCFESELFWCFSKFRRDRSKWAKRFLLIESYPLSPLWVGYEPPGNSGM